MLQVQADVGEIFLEPIVVLDMEGVVHRLNKAARRAFPGSRVGDPFHPQVKDPAVLSGALTRFSRTAEPLFATMELKAEGAKSYRVAGARLSGPHQPVLIGLRFDISSAREFSILSQRVRALNDEVHQHRIARLRLEESLSANLTLYRELQHRVKNHLQMVIGMVALTRRKAKTAEERALLKEFEQRLGAIADVQRLMYDFQRTSGVPADALINAISESFRNIVGADAVTVMVRSTQAELSNEVAPTIALILNELLSNSSKYGCADGRCTLEVSCTSQDRQFELTVRDHGPGFAEIGITSAGTGFGLIRGLCRQIGASLRFFTDCGAWCVVSFSDKRVLPEPAH